MGKTDMIPETDFLRPMRQTVLADDWGNLTKHEFQLKLRDGSWNLLHREVYDHGNAAACLLHNPTTDKVLLTRQFRLPVFLNEHDGYLIEAPAGLLEGIDPAARMKLELEEETGFRVQHLEEVFTAFMSPGSVTEYLVFFIGTYSAQDRVSPGGGLASEGEDIEVLEITLSSAIQKIVTGEICDAKTIMLVQHLAMKKAGLMP